MDDRSDASGSEQTAAGAQALRGHGTAIGAHPTVVILGAGVAGLCMGIQLKQAGISSFTIYEKSDRVGGTWRDNSYPGSGCDVPSHLYCFSFEPKADWTRKFAEQPEIQRYIEDCVERYGLRRHIRFNTEIEGARFDTAAGEWRIRTRAGEESRADVLIAACGQLNRPHCPSLPGLDAFAGTQFHSARWNHDHDLTGKRVAVIGNGASAIQFIPRIAADTAQLYVFQRTANWLVPRLDRAYTAWEQWAFRRLPLVARLYRAFIYWRLEGRFFGFLQGSWLSRRLMQGCTEYIHEQVADPRLRAVLTPDYPVGCKRILISDDYYPALQLPNVEVVTSAIERVTPDAIVSADGVSRPVDTIIFATGFETTTFLAPMEIRGLDGRTLSEVWRDGAEAYLGVSVSGFPNFFMLYGPNTNLGHNSIIFMIECQVGYILRCIQATMRRRLRYLDVRREAMARYNDTLQRDIEKTAWAAGCTSWYKTESGKVTNNWSGFTVAYWWRTRRPDLAAFEQTTR